MPNGKEVKVNSMNTRDEGLAVLKEQTDCYYLEGMLAEN
jgi:hypothetical protein